jgi:hypothetical protein
VAQLVPDHTSLKEIFYDIPRIACHGSETDRNYGLERMLPEPESMAYLLSNYYENRQSLKVAGDWCYKRIHEKPFTWPFIEKKMLQIIEATLSKSAASFKGFGTPAKIV